MSRVQEMIHALEEGAGAKVLKWLLFALAVAGLAMLWNAREFKNFSSPEAMDAAQVARNLADDLEVRRGGVVLGIHRREVAAQERVVVVGPDGDLDLGDDFKHGSFLSHCSREHTRAIR